MILAVADRNHGDIIRGMDGARPAGFWIRVVAAAIDVVVLTLVEFSLGLAARRMWGPGTRDSNGLQFAIFVFTLIFAGLYVTLLHAATGQTIGKLLAGVRVVLVDGGRLPIGTALLRFFAYAFSCLPLGFGFVMAGLRRDRRALHDLVAGTRVERVPERARVPVVLPEAAKPPLA
jgi:uncharacterized RDD family membrane protein YckC